jgi:urease accessory protein
VLADLLRAMHLTVSEETASFEPEGGAYSSNGHNHEHAAPKPINIPIKAAAPHVHGPDCKHDHS